MAKNILRDLPKNLEEKFVFLTACFSGDNSSTITECDLNDWLSDAFTDKGVECYMGFLGENVTTSCPNCTCDGDLYPSSAKNFSDCFWGRILAGDTIRQARDYAEEKVTCGNNLTNSILVNSTPGGCDKNLIG